jgi:hypothetical protein
MNNELLSPRQRMFLRALATLEADHGGAWFFTHAVVRAVAGSPEAGLRSPLRLAPEAERALNPSRVLRRLARRGLVERNRMPCIGSSVRLTDEGRRVALG